MLRNVTDESRLFQCSFSFESHFLKYAHLYFLNFIFVSS